MGLLAESQAIYNGEKDEEATAGRYSVIILVCRKGLQTGLLGNHDSDLI